jgi:hypothetical protein
MTTHQKAVPVTSLTALAALTALLAGCATQDIANAHKGRMFYRSGLLALYQGGGGLDGPVLKPGTHFLGVYDELRVVDCSMTTVTETLDTLTKDGVHFRFDIAVRFAVDCSDEAVRRVLDTVTPDRVDTVSPNQMYVTFIRPAIGEASRELVSPVRANELNEKQAEILGGIKTRFQEMMKTREKNMVVIHEVNVKNLKFPEEMDTANLERAVQAVLRDKAVAERERVTAEIETTRMRRELAEREGDVAAAKIERVGEALKKYPEYLQYDMQLRLPEIYREAGQRGNMILAAPVPLQLPAQWQAPAADPGRVLPPRLDAPSPTRR